MVANILFELTLVKKGGLLASELCLKSSPTCYIVHCRYCPPFYLSACILSRILWYLLCPQKLTLLDEKHDL